MSDYSKEALAKLLVRRDGISKEEAEAHIELVQQDINTICMEGRPLLEAERLFKEEFRLEVDYMDDFIPL
jgi:hypothetical protein